MQAAEASPPRPSQPSPGEPGEDPRLSPVRKTVYAAGDFTVNTVLASLSIVYVSYFLTQVVGLRPELAGAVQLVGRAIDAITDPAMGRLSDRCPWRWGRRRPFFVLGALPFGAAFGLLWLQLPTDSQWALFAYYTAVYVTLSLAMTVLAVPYLALQPELALGYDARTSLNVYRNAGSVLGVFAAILVRPVANAFGGGPEGFMAAGALYGFALAAPWLAVYAATWERPDFQRREARVALFEGLALAARQKSFRRLVGLYLAGRVAMDLVAAMLILFFALWIGRSSDFEIVMTLFFATVLVSLPVWLRVSRHLEKGDVFLAGTLGWAVSLLLLLAVQPDWPRWLLFVVTPLGAIGYAVMDLMPWSMLGEVVDEDDLATGERREGVFYGVFMFVRKLAGSLAVALALALLGALGYRQGDDQNEATLVAIRWLVSVVPALCLLAAAWLAWRYPITRARHAEIRAALARRDGEAPPPLPAA